MRYNRREKTGGQQSQVSLSAPNAAEPSTMPFAQRLTCTIDDACEVTGLGRTKLYELIGAGHIVTITIGRRRLVVVRSLLAGRDREEFPQEVALLLTEQPSKLGSERLLLARSGHSPSEK